MLRSISWVVFLKATLPLLFGWYAVLIWLFYRAAIKARVRRWLLPKGLVLFASACCAYTMAYSQTPDANTGLAQANAAIRSYIDNITQIAYAIGAIMGIVGAINVYQKWNDSDHGGRNISTAVAIWFGGCIFLIIASTVLRSFFGI